MAPFPFPAHQTGRADFSHPAFRQTSRQAHGGGAWFAEDEGRNPEFFPDIAPGEPARAPSRLLVPFGEEASNASIDMVIDRLVGRGAGSVAEVRRPARQQAVQAIADLRPWSLVPRRQEIADLVFDAVHAFLARACAQILS